MAARCLKLGLTVFLFSACGSEAHDLQRHKPGEYHRIVPTNAAAVDLVLDLVGSERVVALPATAEEFSNVSIDSARFGPETRFETFSAEVLLSFAPDLCVVSPWQGQDTITRMGEAGVQVIELAPIESLDDLRAEILTLGNALRSDTRARELVADFDARVTALKASGKARASETAISYTNYGSGGWIAGGGTTADLVMELAGLTNRAAAAGRTGHDTVDLETLLAWDPDWIVVSKASNTFGVTRAYLEGESGLASLRAIREGHIAEVPAALYSTTSHYLVGAAEALVAELNRLETPESPDTQKASEE